METVFVTGGNGFIGRYVVKELLSMEKKVVVLIRDPEHYRRIGGEIVIYGQLNNLKEMISSLEEYSIETCIHLAWEGIPDYSYEMSKKNLLYGMNILELCKVCNIPNLIVTGSCWEYENPIGKVSENDDISYENHFKAAKNSLRMICDAFCKENGIHFNWLRLFYVYGVGQRQGSLIPYIIDTFKQGKQPELNGAYNKNDFIYVSDVAKAIADCARKKPDKTIINIGSGQATEVLEVVKHTAKSLDVELDKSAYVKPARVIDFYADIHLAEECLNWKPQIDMTSGIEKMLYDDGFK